MLELKKVSGGAEAQAHICMPCYYCYPTCMPFWVRQQW